MFSKLSDLISHNQSTDQVIRSIVSTSKFEDLAKSYRLCNFVFDRKDISNRTAHVKCFHDRLEIYQILAETKLFRHIATIGIPKVGKPYVTTYSEDDLINREDFINDLRKIFS